MSVQFIISGQKTFVEKLPDGLKTESLNSKLYSLEFDRDNGFYLLEVADKYSLPAKTYGNYAAAAERVIKTHLRKQGNTGILSTGLKGSGKSLFTKFIANAMIDTGTPVIQINKPYPGAEIFNFIENVGNCVLVFDEFGKNYKTYDSGGGVPTQSGLLSLLDGLGNSKRLHLFTENDVGLISEYLLNRPGRVHYHFKYARLSVDVIQEYCDDMKVPEKVTKELLALCTKLKVLSFDIVSCLINEWKLYGGKLAEHLEILNVSLCRDPKQEEVQVISYTKADGTRVDPKTIRPDVRDNYINFNFISTDKFSMPEYIEPTNINEAVSVSGDIFTFVLRNGDIIIMKIKTVRY